jgi:thiamine-monophosphate kinase
MKTLHNIGEFGLIERIAKSVRTDASVIKGIGDDCAVLKYTKDKYLLFTTDMLIEDVHFTRKEATFFQIGYKAMAVNLSDIAAMGGIPKSAVVSGGLPCNLKLNQADEIQQGINFAAKKFGVNIVGGDTNRSDKIILSVALLGEIEKKNLVLRSTARSGDLIFVTGSLGGSRKKKQFSFIPRIKEARLLVKECKPSAMIDLSDGLASDLERICQASKVGALIYPDLIPLSVDAKGISSALYDGEDFELLFTLPISKAKTINHLFARANFPISCIGQIKPRGSEIKIVNKKGQVRKLEKKHFRHF